MRNFVRHLNFSSVVIAALAVVVQVPASAQPQSLTTLYSFCSLGSPCADGAAPFAGVIQASDGNFYGTTNAGGAYGYGTVFKLTPTGTLTTLYSFCSTQSSQCPDGASPTYAALVEGSDGNLYGTTTLGGVNGYGTVFKITPTGTLTTLYPFCSQTGCIDGATPYAGLVQGGDGNFYGTTQQGGTNGGGLNFGTVFKIPPTGGTPTILYNFCAQPNCADGSSPQAALVQASDGNFYGTTASGGANGQGGTIFKITPTGTFTTVYNFCNQVGCTDGADPEFVALIQANDGNFYGTTINGGTDGSGTIFGVTPTGTLTFVYSFACTQNGCPNGRNPYSGVIQGSDGNLYGTATNGGPNGGDYGTVFKIPLSGSPLTTLYSFCSQPNCADGASPHSGVVEGTDGNLFGTTYSGGSNGYGTVFSLATGLPAAAVTLSATNINFGMYQVGGAYPIPQVQLTNTGTGPLTISSIKLTGANPGDFSESDNCPISPSTLAAGSQCTFAVTFTPAHLGSLSAAISISDNAVGSPQSIALSGTAVNFSVSAVPLSNTIKGGKAARYNVSVTPLGGNTLTASLSVSGCPANTSCTFSPSQLALNGSTASTSTLTVKGSGKTKKGTYTLTINAQVFTVTHSTTVTLVVQ